MKIKNSKIFGNLVDMCTIVLEFEKTKYPEYQDISLDILIYWLKFSAKRLSSIRFSKFQKWNRVIREKNEYSSHRN
jgi:hypothetical protein